MKRTLGLLALVLAVGCASRAQYEDDWGTEDILSGKADGLLDDAPVLEFGESQGGFVEGLQMDIYALPLRFGDQIELEQVVVDGDLSPHFTLFFGATTHISSDTFQRTSTSIKKTYGIARTGQFFIAVKPFRGNGAGRYEIVARCNAGPCTGDPGMVVLTAKERSECVRLARECSFRALASLGTNVGPARARSVFETCLSDGNTSGVTCVNACTGDDDAIEVCNGIINSLPFYADQTAACHEVVASCMSDCYREGDASFGAFVDGPESTCWTNGLNGTCDGYARDHQTCGGSLTDGSHEECMARCEATVGAWVDDLDTLCTETCSI